MGPVSQGLPDFVMCDCILSFCVCINSHERPGYIFVGTTSTELRGWWDQLPVSGESLRLQILQETQAKLQQCSFAFGDAPGTELF